LSLETSLFERNLLRPGWLRPGWLKRVGQLRELSSFEEFFELCEQIMDQILDPFGQTSELMDTTDKTSKLILQCKQRGSDEEKFKQFSLVLVEFDRYVAKFTAIPRVHTRPLSPAPGASLGDHDAALKHMESSNKRPKTSHACAEEPKEEAQAQLSPSSPVLLGAAGKALAVALPSLPSVSAAAVASSAGAEASASGDAPEAHRAASMIPSQEAISTSAEALLKSTLLVIEEATRQTDMRIQSSKLGFKVVGKGKKQTLEGLPCRYDASYQKGCEKAVEVFGLPQGHRKAERGAMSIDGWLVTMLLQLKFTYANGEAQDGDDGGGLASIWLQEVLGLFTQHYANHFEHFEHGNKNLPCKDVAFRKMPAGLPVPMNCCVFRAMGRVACNYLFRKYVHGFTDAEGNELPSNRNGNFFGNAIADWNLAEFVFDFLIDRGNRVLSCLGTALAALADFDPDKAKQWSEWVNLSTQQFDVQMKEYRLNKGDFTQKEEDDEELTFQNLQQFVLDGCRYELVTSRRAGLDRLREGFFAVDNDGVETETQRGYVSHSQHLQDVFPFVFSSGVQLRYLFCGKSLVSAQDVALAIIPKDGTDADEQACSELKRVSGNMDQEGLKSFLSFTTSASNLIPGTTKICVGSVESKEAYCVSSTCTTSLTVPIGLETGELAARLTQSIEQANRLGFLVE
jgi:hypothetical protein